jgi:predicted ATPase with chaperone activity
LESVNLATRLLKAKALPPELLSQALHRQKQSRGFLGNHLLDLGIMDAEGLAKFMPPFPQVPRTFEEVGLPENLLANLFLKHAFFHYSFNLREMSDALKISLELVELLNDYLKQQKFVDVSPRDLLRPLSTHLATDIRYTLSDSGKQAAEQQLEFNSYLGPVPVNLEDYWDWVEAQTIQQVQVKDIQLREAFRGYVVSEILFEEIGPAIASGRSLFLFGPSGNGKTALAGCVGEVFLDPVFIPYALYVQGQIIRVFDEANHQRVSSAQETPGQGRDLRWVLCRRPVVIAGGEMTESALEPKYNPVSKFYEAPHQIQANNGVFIIDDFGRQKIDPKQLLNRWMYPLETRQDFCNLHTGQQFAVPFDQLVIFCTNLDPNTLADEAFLRRIRHKVFIGHISQEQYLEIFRRVCKKYDLKFDHMVVREMMDQFYLQGSRPMRACHPRDLVEKLLDRAKFKGTTPQLNYEDLHSACQTYFVKDTYIYDYDKAVTEEITI